MSELELWNELGNIYYNSGAYDKAIRTCQKVIELDPGSGLPYSNLASIFVCQGRYAEAIPMLKKGIELLDEAKNKAFLWKQLGDAYRKQEDYVNATASYYRAMELDPNNATILEILADLELASRIFDSETLADTNQKNLPSSEPDITEVSSPKIEGTGKSKPGKACWVFKDHEPPLQVERESSDVYEMLPVILGSRILSDATIEADISENPDTLEEIKAPDQVTNDESNKASSPEIKDMRTHDLADGTSPIDPPEAVKSIDTGAHGLLRLGILHWRKGECERAIQFLIISLDTAKRSQNHFLEALCHYTIAQVETDMGKMEDAIQSYQSAANLAPERIFPWNKLGNLNCLLDRYEDARAAFQEAIEHDPKDPVSWNGLGDVFHKLGRNEDAIAAYQLGNVFEKQALDEDVLKDFEKTIDSDQENPQVWNEAGNIYYESGAYIDAITCFRKAIEFDPANATFQASLAKAEQALEEVNSGSEAPTRHTLTEIDPEVLSHPGSLLTKTASPQAEETYTPQTDWTRSEPPQKAEAIQENLSNRPDNAADSEPEAAYWMFKTDTASGNAQQPATYNLPAVSEKVVSTVKPSPAFALKSQHEQAFSGDQVLQDTTHDRASILVQLTPRAVKPTRTEEITNKPVARHGRESASGDVDLELLKSSSYSTEIRTKDSAPHALKIGNQAADQPSLDLQTLENDIAAYRRVTEINPKNDRAWDALGNMYETVGLHNEAIAAFEQAIALDPQREAYHYHLGIALAYQMQYDKAIQTLQKVVALNPNYVLAHCALAGYYRRLGREAEAQEQIKIARPCMDNENEYNQACFESISGDADRAIALLEIALAKQQIQPGMVRSDPDLDFIRKDPRFEALLYKNGITSQ